MDKMKCYGGHTLVSHRVSSRDQVRVVVKAPSKKLAAGLCGVSPYTFNQFFSVTHNETELDILDKLPPLTEIYEAGKEYERKYRVLPWQMRHFTDTEMKNAHPIVLKREYDNAWEQTPRTDDDRRYWIRYLDRLRDTLDQRGIE